jgi:hypothetical protein
MRNCEAVQKLTKPIIFILIGFLLLLSGCKNVGDSKLKEPTNLRITDDEYLEWDTVSNAKNYSVYVKKNNEKSYVYETDDTKLDVFEVMDEVGKYEFSVLACGDNNYYDSDYSLILNYEIDSQIDNLDFSLVDDYYELSIKEPKKIQGKLILPAYYNGKRVDINEKINYQLCDNMTSIIVPDTMTNNGVFLKCAKLCRIKLSNGCTILKQSTIKDCDLLKEISLPQNVTTLQPEAITNCKSLQKVYIGQSVSNLSNRNFSNCDNIDTILVDENNETYKSVDNCILRTEDYAIVYGNKNSKIPSISTKICDYAFIGSFFDELIIPSNIRTIGYAAFSNCPNLKKVIIEEGIEEIDNAFINCGSLEEIYLPNSIKNLGKTFFFGLKSLNKINIKDDNHQYIIDGNCLIRKSDLKLIFAMSNPHIPNYIKSIGYGAFSLTSEKEIIIPDSVEAIDECAFRQSNIEKVVMGLNLKTVGTSAFEYSSNLKEVVLNQGLIEIGDYAFLQCYQLENITIANTIKTIGEYAFYNCLCSILLPNSIERVGNYAFYYCTIYTNFDSIEFNAFKIKNRKTPDSVYLYYGFKGCSIFLSCDIINNYVYSFIYSFDDGEEKYNFKPVFDIGSGDLIIDIPFREGYEFLGFSEEENSDVIKYKVILIESDFEVSNGESLIRYRKKYYIPFDYDTIVGINIDEVLYSVWKKVE